MIEFKAGYDAEIPDELHPVRRCKVCGAILYSTDRGNHETTYHCSSKEAKFWDFERGTAEQIKAKEHWDMSKLDVFENNNQ